LTVRSLALALLFVLGATPAAAAEDSASDGVYGRFDGDLELALAGGAELERDGQRIAARLTLHYFSMMGLTAGLSERAGGNVEHTRVASVGVDLRPAFVPRWAKNMQQGPGFFDLTIDSLSLGMAAFWATPGGGDFGDRRGLELSGGLGVPLTGRAGGPWLEARALGRWADDRSRGEAALLALLSWRTHIETPLAR
jgi:hypothetical protein